MKNLILLFALFLAGKSLAQQRGIYLDETTEKYGLADPETGEPMTAPIFNFASHLEGTDSLATAQMATGWGLFSSSGRTIIPPVFDAIEYDRLGARALGFVAVLKGEKRGLAQLADGKPVLPTEFEAVGAFSFHTFFGRRKDSEKLELFDRNGQKTGEIDGVLVYPSHREGFWRIWEKDNSWSLVDEKGTDFSKGAVAAGSVKIFQSLDKNGSPDAAFLLNEWGDTLLKNAFEIRETAFNRFLVGLKNKPFSRFGLCDETGKWLIDPTEKTFKTLGERLSPSGFLVATDGKGNEQIFRKNGQILIDSCRIRPILEDRNVTRRAKNSAADRFFAVEKIGQKASLGLFRFNGEPVLPMEFLGIFCATDQHALIVSKPRTERGFLHNAFDLETGRKLFADDFEMLLFTADPQVFWAKKMDSWALVNPFSKSSEPPKFDVAYVIQLTSGCFEIYEKGSRKVVDPTGQKLLARDLDGVRPPTQRQFEQFFERTGRRGQLVAVETRRREPKGAWHSISLGGERLFFETENPPEKAKIADSDAVVEAEMTDAVIVKKMDEAPPPYAFEPTDEPLVLAEQPPKFPSGEAALLAFLNQNLKYPPLAKENGIQGKAIVQFIVEKDGSLTDPKIVRDIGGGCGNEALRLVGLMPKWAPGRQNGQAVRVKYTLPVLFKLD